MIIAFYFICDFSPLGWHEKMVKCKKLDRTKPENGRYLTFLYKKINVFHVKNNNHSSKYYLYMCVCWVFLLILRKKMYENMKIFVFPKD